MKCFVSVSAWFGCRTLVLLAFCAALWPASQVHAQGVTTGALAGVVTNPQQQPIVGASVIAVHEPSGTSYEATSRADGRFFIPGMRVGGPYSVTVAYTGGAGAAFEPQTKSDVTVNLGAATDLSFTVTAVAVQETITVTGEFDPIFSSSHTGAATAISRFELSTIPTMSGRLTDVTRLTPQSNGSSIAGSDGRMNNITVDGSSFNSSFGVSASQPGDRTGVAPISLEAIEQVQVNIAPYDVRQGSFVGAGVNTVTRSGGNRLSGSFFHRYRDQDWVGTETKGQPFNPGTFEFRNTGGWASGPIIRNKWFTFGNYEDELDTRPLTLWQPRRGSEPVVGNVTRVLESDLNTLSQFLATNFNYETGPFTDLPDETPAKRFLLRNDYNLNNNNKVSFRYNHLNSFTDIGMSNSTSALRGRNAGSSSFLTFQNSNYQILENIRSGIGEWHSVMGNTIANSFQAGYTYQDESRDTRGGDVFPFVEIYEGGQSYTAFGFEPFTFNNELRYKTLQFQNNLTRFGDKHSQTFGAYVERFQSENVFFSCCPQSAYSYNSLADFYTDAAGYLANPNRTVAPVSLAQFQVRYSNIPGNEKATQELDVWYTAGYAQDEWRVRPNLTVTSGIRFDVTRFSNESFPNAAADALTFRDENGQSVQYSTGKMPDPKVLWSPRVGLNWDVAGNQQTQVRGGTGIFSGKPAYVWVSNQLGNTGVLIAEIRNTAAGTAFPFHPDPDHYKLAPTGASAASYTLNVTDADFKFPQVWRTNVAFDQKFLGGFVSTTEYFYARNINGAYYIDANLPAAQSAFVGADSRPRWTANRLNTTPGNVVNNAFVLKNGEGGSSWNFAQSLSRIFRSGLSLRAAYSYGESTSLVDPESTAATTFARVTHHADANNAGVQTSMWSPGHRAYALVSFSREYFSFGATTITAFWETRPSTNTGSTRLSYVFASDMNGDGSTNDLIYIPRDTSEMNFSPFTVGTRTFTAAEQATAFESYIQQDAYLRDHRGQYAQRNALSFPMLRRLDLSVTQDIFRNLAGRRHAFQVRADFLNFGNLLNSNWGAGSRTLAAVNSNNQIQLLTNPTVDALGRSTYRLAVVNNELVTRSFQSSAFTSDVYEFMISLRYTFN
jgi:hypothetical protein